MQAGLVVVVVVGMEEERRTRRARPLLPPQTRVRRGVPRRSHAVRARRPPRLRRPLPPAVRRPVRRRHRHLEALQAATGRTLAVAVRRLPLARQPREEGRRVPPSRMERVVRPLRHLARPARIRCLPSTRASNGARRRRPRARNASTAPRSTRRRGSSAWRAARGSTSNRRIAIVTGGRYERAVRVPRALPARARMAALLAEALRCLAFRRRPVVARAARRRRVRAAQRLEEEEAAAAVDRQTRSWPSRRAARTWTVTRIRGSRRWATLMAMVEGKAARPHVVAKVAMVMGAVVIGGGMVRT